MNHHRITMPDWLEEKRAEVRRETARRVRDEYFAIHAAAGVVPSLRFGAEERN